MDRILILSDLATDRYLKDWAIMYSLGGGIFVLVGLVFSWLIWRKCKNAAQKVEEQNRKAGSEFREASKRVKRLKSELSNASED